MLLAVELEDISNGAEGFERQCCNLQGNRCFSCRAVSIRPGNIDAGDISPMFELRNLYWTKYL